MQPDLPWNVAGIPPEAREAARAAARREGLSVGEWLTRKILRGLSDAARGYETTPPETVAVDNWRGAPAPAAYRNAAESAAAAARDTEDMLARVSRSEDEAQSAGRRIEDQLKNVARRLDAAERSQSENNRAMGKAAAEINVAAREQAQAFDQLDAHVIALADRLSRVEHTAKDSGLKDAVKGLHQGLSRLADQIAETANRSATQVSTLAENVEALAGRLAQTRHDAEIAAKALRDHLLTVDQRVQTVEANEGSAKALKDHLLTVDRRVQAVEANDGPAKALAQLRETLDGLSSRVQTTDAQSAGAMARLEDSVRKLESRDDGSRSDRRLQGIEQSLAELMSRADHDAERQAIAAMEDEIQALNARMEDAQRAHRAEVAELRAALEKAETRPVVMAAPQPVAAPVPQPAGFDLPPFPQAQPAQMVPPPPADVLQPAFAAAPPPFAAAAPSLAPAPNFVAPFDHPDASGPEAPEPANSAFAALGQQHGYRPTPMDATSYISTTRRNARAASEAQQAGAHGWAT
ncbi:MAG: hypothetical protein KGL26_06290, partial [Pseudomonadota bacterium]|nr:hypothetical protein [Pseudomonadota bacterium]